MNPVVALTTSAGVFTIELEADKAPGTVKNFLDYVDAQFYDNTIFHRVIKGFMIQGGGFEPGMKQKATKGKIKNESSNGLSNLRGTVAMARTSEPDSAAAQFFVNTVDNLFLDRARASDQVGYCVFGKVVEGLDVIEAIRGVPTATKNGHGDVPVKDVVIQSIRRVEA